MSLAGKWEGKLLDASGPSARVVADLKDETGRVAGEFSVYVESARDGCSGTGWKLAQTAPISGSYAEKDGTLHLQYELKVGPKPISVAFDAKVVDADPHARRALVGAYTVTDEGAQMGFEGGACLLWQYGR